MNTVCFKITSRLPIVVDGGNTRWRVELEHFGKNGNMLALMARCLDDKREIVIEEGKKRTVESCLRMGVWIQLGTPQSKILSRMVRDGLAVVVSSTGDGGRRFRP